MISKLKADFWRRSFAKIYFSGWWPALGAIGLGMTLSVLLFGFWMPYWKVADLDMILAYQALLFNDGKAQEFFDHTGYLNDLMIAGWYQLLHWFGMVHAHALSALPSPSDGPAYAHAWQVLIESGRLLSLILGAVFVWVFATLTRRLVGDWRIAIMAGLALAYSGSFVWHIRIMRTELLSAALVISALLLVLVAGREADYRRYALIAVASLCATLAVVAKVQALVPVLAIPAIAVAFGQPIREAGDRFGGRQRWLLAACATLAAAVVAYPAMDLLRVGISEMPRIAMYRPLGAGLSGIYQWLIAAWVIGGVVAYGIVWRVPMAAAVTALASVALGVGAGLLSLRIYYDVRNVVAVANPIEHMFVFASFGRSVLSEAPQILSSAFFMTLVRGLGQVLAVHSFVFAPIGRPTLLLEWFAIAGAIVMSRRGERNAAAQVGLLILAAWGIDTVFSVRNLQSAYFVYTDPLLIIAAAVALVRFPQLERTPRVQNIALSLAAIYLVWGHLEPVRQVIIRGNPEETCEWLPLLKQVGPFPICRSRTSEAHRHRLDAIGMML